MMNIERGIFWDKPWTITKGCKPVSPGCRNCWAAKETHMRSFQRNEKIRTANAGLVTDGAFNGTVRFMHDNLSLPTDTKKPSVFALWLDIFSPLITNQHRDLVFKEMQKRPDHTYLCITKNARIAFEYISSLVLDKPGGNSLISMLYSSNIWLVITAENQACLDSRIDYAIAWPGPKALLLEPMLGKIIIPKDKLRCFNQVIVGGENGKKARPIHPYWVARVRDICAEVKRPFFFKGWGAYKPIRNRPPGAKYVDDLSEGYSFKRCSDKENNRKLDGREHNELAWRKD